MAFEKSKMRLKIATVGEPVLRYVAAKVSKKQLLHPDTQNLIAYMRETMRDAPGVGLAAPQIGISLQIAVIEDKAEYHKGVSAAEMRERERRPCQGEGKTGQTGRTGQTGARTSLSLCPSLPRLPRLSRLPLSLRQSDSASPFPALGADSLSGSFQGFGIALPWPSISVTSAGVSDRASSLPVVGP